MEKTIPKPFFKLLFLPKNNLWFRRMVLVFSFIFFDYLSTMVFCREPRQEANLLARGFMESFGVPLGLTFFVFLAGLPIYVVLCLDSNIVRLSFKAAAVIETLVDLVFAWFVAGLHFAGGTSWFLPHQGFVMQLWGAFLYLTIAFAFVRSHKPVYGE